MSETALVPRSSGTALSKRELADSRLFKDINTPAKAAVVMAFAQNRAMDIIFAACNLFFVGGKPAMTGLMLATLLKLTQRYRYVVHEKTAKVCKIEFFEKLGESWERVGTETYTMEMAARAGLANGPSWKKFPEQMLFWRALSAGARCYCPDALCGGPAHLIEELRPGAEYNEDGVPVQAGDVQDAEIVTELTEAHRQVEQLLLDTQTDRERFLAHYGAANITSLDSAQCEQAIATLAAKKQAQSL